MAMPSPVFELRVVLTVDNYETALRFYRDALGLPEIRAFEGPGGGGTLLAAGQATVEILARPASAAVDRLEVGRLAELARVRLALEVADSDDVREHLENAGARRLGDPVDTPWRHRSVRLQGPEGVQLTLFTVLPETEDQAR